MQNKIDLLKAIRGLILSSEYKLTLMVKPCVVMAEYRNHLRSIRQILESSDCDYKEKKTLLLILDRSDNFDRTCKIDCDQLRKALRRIKNSLPSLV